MVCHIDKETGGLVVLIPLCISCKRALKQDEIHGTGDNTMTMTAPTVIRKVLFACPRGHVKFQVGRIDLVEMAKYPSDKIRFESADIDPNQFARMRV